MSSWSKTEYQAILHVSVDEFFEQMTPELGEDYFHFKTKFRCTKSLKEKILTLRMQRS